MTYDLFQLLNQNSKLSKGCVEANVIVFHTNLSTVRLFIKERAIRYSNQKTMQQKKADSGKLFRVAKPKYLEMKI